MHRVVTLVALTSCAVTTSIHINSLLASVYAHENPHANTPTVIDDPHEHGHSPGHQNMHHHGTVEVPDHQPVPTLRMIVHEDSQRGWNLELQTTNFEFAPERVNQEGFGVNEGHGHLYINGTKITRLYGNWYFLEDLAPGRNEITVTLNTNTHEIILQNGQPIADTVVIEIPTTD